MSRLIALALLLNFETIAQIDSQQIPLPTTSQISWSKSELGVLISYDLPVFQGKPYNQKQNRIEPIPDQNSFNPQQLSTDQWIQASKFGVSRHFQYKRI